MKWWKIAAIALIAGGIGLLYRGLEAGILNCGCG